MPPDEAPRHIAAMTASLATGQAIGPVLAGWVYDVAGSFSPVLVATAIALVAAAAILNSSPPERTFDEAVRE